MQITSQLLMIRPGAFGFNKETAVNNAFQKMNVDWNVNEKAQQEFDQMTDLLRYNKIDVHIIQDRAQPYTPDAVFPNNWISTHPHAKAVLYPMFASNRRAERAKGVLEALQEQFEIVSTLDLTGYEEEGYFLEGTGSMVLDRLNQRAYACISPRTSARVLYDFCEALDFTPVIFDATDRNGTPVYHTNVMMSVADDYAIIAQDTIKDRSQRYLVLQSFLKARKEIVFISLEQMEHFAANALQVKSTDGQRFLVMSEAGYRSLSRQQRKQIEKFNPILHSPLDTIEQNGGGSARCMIAEIFLPQHAGEQEADRHELL
ncbi:arginine deiminase-related protein [Niabella pedocola]|uniref:Arginine deiminase-related protein n=1 Tax=Niabella pedocola TaxID=1752077 RepID=A0ABS8PVL1_9BACT|nr:arginine deiminase-related protein [Niabella pedocola]MCD2425113.1 arginine deiminase-related protein [Niabella pedocola]